MTPSANGLGRSSSPLKRAAEFLSILMMLLLGSLPLFSQAAVGTILGGVFDSSGGAIAGAQVTIIDVARGTTRALTTDSAGQYTAPSLLSGTYTVRAQAQGFQTVERTNVLLEVAQDVRIDLRLSPGAQAQTVTVTAEVPAIDTTNSTLGGTVTNQAVGSLPLVTRNFLDLLQLRPGVVNVPGNPTATTTNGRRTGADVLLIEGVTQFDLATSNVLINGSQKGGAVDELPLDSVQEFSSQQNPQAEYGWRDGSAVNVAVKSGTNSIHGSAYAFGRDAAATDAKQFNALPGIPETVGNLTVEQPGFTLGGPLLKDKLFWFVSAEFIRQSSFATSGATVPADVPGVTGSIVDACNAVGRAKVNSLSAQIAGLLPGSCTPTPASSTFENLFPASSSGVIALNPVTSVPSNNGLAKVDYSPNAKHHFDGFVYISREETTIGGAIQPFWGSVGTGSTSEYAGAWTWTPKSNWVNDFRVGAAPNTGLQFAGDASKIPGNAYPGGYSINTGISTAGLGFMCLQITGTLTFNGSNTGLGNCSKYGARGPQYQLDFTDKVSYLHGNHAFKVGYEEVFVHFDDASTATENGTVTFNNLQQFLQGTTNTGTVIIGNNTDQWREHWHAAFVQDTWRITPRVTLTPGIRWEYIGSPHSAVNHLGIFNPNTIGGVEQVGPGLPQHTLIHPEKANFNPRVGVAWDIFGNGKTVLRGGVGNFDSFPAINAVAGASVPYGATLCSATPCDAAHPANIVVNNFGQPVQGFFPETLSFRKGSLPWPTNYSCTDPTQTSTCSGGAIFTQASTAISATSGPTCTPTTQCSMLTVDPNFRYPKSLQWNVDLQRAITNNLTLDVAYVGVHGYHETHTVDVNEPALGTGWNPNSKTQTIFKAGCLGTDPANPVVYGPLTSFTSNCTPDSAAELAARPYNAQFPYLGFIAQTQSGFLSNYNGLQVTLDARNFHGLSFLTAYTFSHALDDWTKSSQATEALADPAHPQYQYGNSDLDVRHRLRFSPTYAIPGRKGFGQMLEGWQVSGIWALQSGFAWAPNDQSTDDWGGTGEVGDTGIPRPNNGNWQSWNYTGPHSAFNGNGDVPIPCYGQAPGCTPWKNAPTATWQTCSAAAQAPYGTPLLQDLALAALTSANGACYIQKGGILTPPAYGTLGNASRGLFVGPKYENVDVALEKMWHIKERYAVQLRIEVYNVLNQVSFMPFSDGSSDPSAGGGVIAGGGQFGFATSGLIGDGGSSNRQFQFGLKIMF